MITRYLLPLLAAGAFGFAALQMTEAWQKAPPTAPPGETVRLPFRALIAAAGIVEPETENIAIGTPLPGVVEHVLVNVGDAVRAGQPLFRLDDRQLRAELEVRLASLGTAKASWERLTSMPRQEELPPLRAKLAEAEANLHDQAKMLERARRSGAAASAEELTRRQAGVAVAEAVVARAKADLALAEAGAWRFDQRVSAAAVKQAEAMVEQTKTEIDRLTVRAPHMRCDTLPSSAATAAVTSELQVLQVNVRPGEFVGTVPGRPLVVLGCVGRLHVRADIDENDIPRFRPGLAGTARPRGSGATAYPVRFVRVEPYVIPKRSLTGSGQERVDTRVLQVIYRIEPSGRSLYVGQQLDVFLDAGEKSIALHSDLPP